MFSCYLLFLFEHDMFLELYRLMKASFHNSFDWYDYELLFRFIIIVGMTVQARNEWPLIKRSITIVFLICLLFGFLFSFLFSVFQVFSFLFSIYFSVFYFLFSSLFCSVLVEHRECSGHVGACFFSKKKNYFFTIVDVSVDDSENKVRMWL